MRAGHRGGLERGLQCVRLWPPPPPASVSARAPLPAVVRWSAAPAHASLKTLNHEGRAVYSISRGGSASTSWESFRQIFPRTWSSEGSRHLSHSSLEQLVSQRLPGGHPCRRRCSRLLCRHFLAPVSPFPGSRLTPVLFS